VYTGDRRATRFRVTLRSWVPENPAHGNRVGTDYTWKSPLVKHTVALEATKGLKTLSELSNPSRVLAILADSWSEK
jgi:hypothetical protein